jgi:DUF4097 and DUF4098 domain-containing protein YvlB
MKGVIMGDEQRKILQMVADGKISADDGAKLLEALEKGGGRSERDHRRRSRSRKKVFMEGSGLGDLKGVHGLKDIGRMIKSMVSESLSGLQEDLDLETEDFDDNECIVMSEPVELQQGMRLFVTRSSRRGHSGDLMLHGNEGTMLEIEGEDHPEVRMIEDGDTLHVHWVKGDLSLSVPSSVESVEARLSGGDIAVTDLSASCTLKTKGGDLMLSGVSESFLAKTMGGNIVMDLASDWGEDSVAKTMGGNIQLRIPGDTSAFITARTMGGDISVPDGLKADYESGHPGSSRVSIDLSNGEEAPELVMKTMGGNIQIQCAD